MKKTITLLTLFVSLFALTYFLEEASVYKIIKLNQAEKLLRSITLKDVSDIKLRKVHLFIDKDKWYTKKNYFPVSTEKLDTFLEKFSGLRIEKVLESDTTSILFNRKEFIEFKMSDNFIKIYLGDKLKFSTNFYLKIVSSEKEFIVLADYSSFEEVVYQRELEGRHSAEYKKIVKLLSSKSEEFISYELFSKKEAMKLDEVKSIWFENTIKKNFTISFNPYGTVDQALDGLSYHPNSFINLIEELKTLKAIQIIQKHKVSLISSKTATLLIKFENEFKSISLYRKYGSLNGYFVTISGSNRLYELDALGAKFFFYNPQDFWNTNPVDNLNGFAEILFPNKVISFDLKNRVFSINNRRLISKNSSLSQIIDLLQKRPEFVKAGYKRAISKIVIKVGEKKFGLYFDELEKSQLIIKNLVTGVEFYYYPTFPLFQKFKEFF